MITNNWFVLRNTEMTYSFSMPQFATYFVIEKCLVFYYAIMQSHRRFCYVELPLNINEPRFRFKKRKPTSAWHNMEWTFFIHQYRIFFNSKRVPITVLSHRLQTKYCLSIQSNKYGKQSNAVDHSVQVYFSCPVAWWPLP